MSIDVESATDLRRCPDAAHLRSFSRGELDEADASTIAGHLQLCETCAEILESYLREPGTLIEGLRRENPAAAYAHEREFRELVGLTEAIHPAVEPIDEWLPYRLDEYHIVDRIASGGMGTVLKAYHPSLARYVALKRLSPQIVNRETINRFRTEPWFGSRLQHPNVVQVFSVGRDVSAPYFTMELLEGGTLETRLRQAVLPPAEAAALTGTLARALGYCHQQGVLHRDLKPSNVLFTKSGIPKIADFGLAKATDETELFKSLTQSNAIMGTPHYMAPEQARGAIDEVGVETDIYALGAILYRAIAGRPPHRGANNLEVLQHVAQDPPPRLSQSVEGIDPDLDAICAKCLAKDPADRYSSAEALADDLERAGGGMRTHARAERLRRSRRSVIRKLLAGSLAASLAVGVPLSFRRDPDADWAEYARNVLTSGETLELIGATGLPQWHRLTMGVGGSCYFAAGNDGIATFNTDTSSACLLLDHVPVDAYRFECELRHDQSAFADAGIGLVMAHCEAPVGNLRTMHFAITLKYNDQIDYAKFAAQHLQRDPGFAGNPLTLQAYLVEVDDGRITETETRVIPINGDAVRIAPRTGFLTWRKVVVEVDRGRMTATWDPGKDGRILAIDLEDARSGFAEVIPKVVHSQQHAAALEQQVATLQRGGLGVYIYNGKLSIRNAMIRAAKLGS